MNAFRLDPDGIYRCDAFRHFEWQQHGFGARSANPKADVTLRQIHSANVLNACGLKDRESEGDALLTNEIGRAIGIRTADCVPILLLDGRTRAVGAVHAGWRGTAAEIARAAIRKLTDDFGTDPSDLFIALGPCIRRCCYAVGPEVIRVFSSYFPERGVLESSARLDLAEANRRQLLRSGVIPDRIFDCGFCTACGSDRFFSYRREPDNPGRMISAIARIE